MGDLTDEDVAFVVGRVVVFLACEGGLLSLVAASRARARAFSTMAATTAPGLPGLDSFTGDAGRDIYDKWCFSGEPFSGET